MKSERRLGTGTDHKGTQETFRKVRMRATQVNAFVKTNGILEIRSMYFTMCKLYFNNKVSCILKIT
jgi:hypothetical protein